jgi:hypothetical protein
MWIILILTIIAYAINVLVIRGFLTIDGWHLRWVSRNRVHVNLTEAENEEELETKEMANQLYL